jgi:hypothetical protein
MAQRLSDRCGGTAAHHVLVGAADVGRHALEDHAVVGFATHPHSIGDLGRDLELRVGQRLHGHLAGAFVHDNPIVTHAVLQTGPAVTAYRSLRRAFRCGRGPSDRVSAPVYSHTRVSEYRRKNLAQSRGSPGGQSRKVNPCIAFRRSDGRLAPCANAGRPGRQPGTDRGPATYAPLGRVGCGMRPLGEDRREISDIGLGNSQHWNLMASGKLDLVLGFRHVSRILAAPHLSDGSFVRVSADHLDVPLFWQCWKLDSPIVARITEAVTSAADEMRPRAN